jgi:enoyl-CoA hydratase
MTPGLHVEHDAGVLRLTLHRPATLNALTAEDADRLAAELEGTAARDDVRVVLVAGAGDAFCAGADLSGADAHENFDVTALDRANRIVRAVTMLDRPVVAGVRGVAAGVGCSLALACDLVVAAESARVLLAFSRIGLMPDGGATATVAASVGRARAMRMALLGEGLTGQEAYGAGLVSHVAPDDEHAEVVEALVRRVAAGPPSDRAAAHGRRGRGDARVRRAPATGLPGRVTAVRRCCVPPPPSRARGARASSRPWARPCSLRDSSRVRPGSPERGA